MPADETTTWVALVGRRDEPVDGIEDYCAFLARGLERQGVKLELVRVRWAEIGWTRAWRELANKSHGWKGKWVLLQYTALSWSRRGLPFRVLPTLRKLHSAGARIVVVFHEPHRQFSSSSRWLDLLRGMSQDFVVQQLYEYADKAVFTVPLEAVNWLPESNSKAAFIPIGANVPERLERRSPTTMANRHKTVLVFGVTGAPAMEREVEEIAGVIRETSKAIAKLRLVVIGRGALEAREQLAIALTNCDVNLIVRGILPAEEVSDEMQKADALLFVRGPVTIRRGSALAGVACGVPIVGYGNGTFNEPLISAGVEWSPWQDRASLVRGLVRVLGDTSRWTELHERNIAIQKSQLSWDQIAERYCTVLGE